MICTTLTTGPDYEFFDLLIYVLLYGPTTYLVLYGYDRWSPTKGQTVGYVAGWALLTTGLEWLSTLCHVFHFTGWHHYYSIPVYALVYAMNLALFRTLRAFYGRVPT